MSTVRQDALTRFTVSFETDGEDTEQEKEFPSLSAAKRFAKKITTDGTAWPEQADIYKDVRESHYRRWESDETFVRIIIIDGKEQ